jgi:signal transduction histidine kinase
MADAGLAVAVGLIQVLGTVFGAHHHASHREVDGLAIPLLLAGPAALAARRRHPLVVLWVVFAATLTYTTIGYPPGPIFLALIVAFFTAVIAGHRLAGWAAIAAGWALFLWLGSAVGTASAPSLVEALALTAWLLVLLAAAEFVRGRHERAAEARHAREEEARRRAGEERLRIARELHDVLAHNISLINVQAGVALHLIDERPEQARTALAAIKQASSETLREMRSVLGVLRQVDEHAPRSPAPSLARLGELVERAGAAGLTVGVEEEGRRRPLPAGVDLAAFRIV